MVCLELQRGQEITVKIIKRNIGQQVCGNGIKGAFKKLGSFVKGNKEAFRPLAKSLKQSGNEAIAQAAMRALDEGVDPSLVSAYANMSSSALQGPRQQGSGFIKKLNKFVKHQP